MTVETKSLTELLTAPTETTATNSEKVTRAEFEKKCRITLSKKIKPLTPSITIGGATVCTEGGILVVSGQKKAGKSHGILNIIATALMPEVDTNKTLSIRANHTEKKIVYVDTEQHESTSQDFINKIMRIAKLDKEPVNLEIFNITPFGDYRQKWEVIQEYILTIPDLGLLVLDGVADIVKSVNDEEKGKEIVDNLLAKIGNTSVVVTIHEGKDNNGATGHVGQIFEKKCTGTVAFFKDRKKQIHTIKCKMVRGAGDFEDILFKWDDSPEHKGFRLLDDMETKAIEQDAKEAKSNDLVILIKKCFGQNRKIAKKELQKLIRTHDTKLDLTVQEQSIMKNINRKIKDSADFGIITIDTEGNYNYNLT